MRLSLPRSSARTFELTPRAGLRIILAVSLLLYASSLWNHFAYDDVAVIRDDPRVHSIANIPKIFATNYWNNQAQALYRPLVSSSFAADWAVAGNHPGWFHFTNILWNAAACVLVFLVLAELFPVAGAVAGALLFAVHPVHVEAVANVVGRAELMAAVFSMGAALLWLRTPRDGEHDRKTLFFTIPALFFLGAACKESAVMLPPLLVLLDMAQGRLRRGSVRQWLRARTLPFVALAIAGGLFLALRASVLHVFGPSNLDAALEVAPRGMPRILTALQAWPTYLRLIVFPRILLADYGPRILLPVRSLTPLAAAGMAILVACISGGIIAAWRGHGRTALALLWMPIAMLPVSNLLFPIGILVAERTLYLPLFSVAVAVAAVFSSERAIALAGRLLPGRKPLAVAWMVTISICAAFAVRTLVRIPDWKSTGTIFSALTRDRPDSFRAEWHLARRASDAKNAPLAFQHYANAINLWPFRTRLLKEASGYAVNNGDLVFARQIAEQGVRAWPKDPDFRRSVAGITLDLGDTARAVVLARQGLEVTPGDPVLLAIDRALGAWKKTHNE